jgi:hypothetical protein
MSRAQGMMQRRPLRWAALPSSSRSRGRFAPASRQLLMPPARQAPAPRRPHSSRAAVPSDSVWATEEAFGGTALRARFPGRAPAPADPYVGERSPDRVDRSLVSSALCRQSEVPAANGHTTARGLAAFLARLLEGCLAPGVGDVGASGFALVLGNRSCEPWPGLRRRTRRGDGRTGRPVGRCPPGNRPGLACLTTVPGGEDPAEQLENVHLACAARNERA